MIVGFLCPSRGIIRHKVCLSTFFFAIPELRKERIVVEKDGARQKNKVSLVKCAHESFCRDCGVA